MPVIARALMTDGPFAEGKEHIGGFSIVMATDIDVARRCPSLTLAQH